MTNPVFDYWRKLIQTASTLPELKSVLVEFIGFLEKPSGSRSVQSLAIASTYDDFISWLSSQPTGAYTAEELFLRLPAPLVARCPTPLALACIMRELAKANIPEARVFYTGQRKAPWALTTKHNTHTKES